MIAGDRASRSYRTTRLTSQSQSRQERRGCEARTKGGCPESKLFGQIQHNNIWNARPVQEVCFVWPLNFGGFRAQADRMSRALC